MAKINFDSNKDVKKALGVKIIPEYDNFVIGEILSIEVTEKVSDAKTGYQFAGYSVPNLVIKFKQKIDAFNKEERLSTISFKPVVTIKNSGLAMDEDTFSNLVMGQYDVIKHILDTFEGLANFKALGKLTAIDSSSETEVLLKDFKSFFEGLKKAFDGKDGKGVYVGQEVTVKFIFNKDEKYLSMPRYVNTGFIQLAKFNKQGKLITSLEFKGETIKFPTKVQDGNMSAMPGAPVAPVADIDLTTL